MSRYFFNIHNDDGGDLYDDVGVHLATRADIHRRMMSMAIDLVDGMRPDDQPWRVEVLDASGTIVCSMDIGIERERSPYPVASGVIRDVSKGGLPTIYSLRTGCAEPLKLSYAKGRRPRSPSNS